MSEPSVAVRADPEDCSTCEHCSVDGGNRVFCIHPDVVKHYPLGLHPERAIREFCGPELKLREERVPNGV